MYSFRAHRYEWFKVDKIVRSANSNAQNVKHGKKVKNKTEKSSTEKLTDEEDTSPSWNHSVLGFSETGVAHDGFPKVEGRDGKPAPQFPVKPLFSGLPASESSSNNESEREMDTGSSSMAFDAVFSSSSSSPLETEQATKANLENMSSTERIAFLQEKLKDIRSHYLSLKSEVASIDRRRKLMKKKRGGRRLIHKINKKQRD
ncbi:AT-rich interactive domain-containing protein 4B-like isoform X2 [Scleropages formosus]|uniref:AT-rich interactive domain-containing protein 4B-like isoform X2 n=1 Tax=Scleropages formosus TaxID=113540 RepID=UPI000878E785|nr:AT-rich interactive domain-containing protein 4B-like isoform X2 [Scleropages formosus]